jgi:hypothetical protein
MNIFHLLTAQMQGMQLPLFAVSLTAIPRANTPVLLMMHWHGFRKTIMPKLPEIKPILQPIPGSALQINQLWHQSEVLEEAVLDAAWQLGAWDVKREEHRACNTIGASVQEAEECKQAFGVYEHHTDFTPLLAEAPDQEDMLHLGAKVGFVRWLFRPVNGGLWQDTADDDTLLADGRREPPCPIKPQALKGGKLSHTDYRLGKVNRIILL